MTDRGLLPDRFFFVHLLKTAGTELLLQFRHQFGDRGVYPIDEDGGPERVLDILVLEQSLAARGDEIRVIAGHFPLATVELLPGAFTTLTVLRDPVERTLSFLRHQRVYNADERDVPLEKIYDNRPRFDTLIHNHMVKMLSLPAADIRPGGMLTEVSVTAEDLIRAKAALAEIDVVGLQEQYGDFCELLETRFGWDLGSQRRANTTKPEPVTDAFRERIAAENHLDVELYEFAVELVSERAR